MSMVDVLAGRDPDKDPPEESKKKKFLEALLKAALAYGESLGGKNSRMIEDAKQILIDAGEAYHKSEKDS